MAKPKPIVYLIRNKVNGKKYVGKTSCGLKTRWTGHKTAARAGERHPLCRAIRKYGADNFTQRVLETFSTCQQAFDAEDGWIEKHQSRVHQHGYNCRTGGEGGFLVSEESRKRMSIGQKALGRRMPESHRKLLSEINKTRPRGKKELARLSASLRRHHDPLMAPTTKKIKKLHRQGLCNKDIAKQVGLSQGRLSVRLRELGLTKNPRPRYAPVTDKLAKQIIKLRLQGLEWKAIREKLKCSEGPIARVLKENGLKVRQINHIPKPKKKRNKKKS